MVLKFGGICLTYLLDPKFLLTLKFGSICLTKLLNPKCGSPLKLPKASDTQFLFWVWEECVWRLQFRRKWADSYRNLFWQALLKKQSKRGCDIGFSPNKLSWSSEASALMGNLFQIMSTQQHWLLPHPLETHYHHSVVDEWMNESQQQGTQEEVLSKGMASSLLE